MPRPKKRYGTWRQLACDTTTSALSLVTPITGTHPIAKQTPFLTGTSTEKMTERKRLERERAWALRLAALLDFLPVLV
jgi:hypothetical protein